VRKVVELIQWALTLACQDLEKRIDLLTGGATTYTPTPQIAEIKAAYLALHTLEQKISHVLSAGDNQ